jgi:tripartite-type tricarboxylate transporter receptor subunit TctC
MRAARFCTALLAFSLIATQSAQGQEWPSRTIRLIVPFPPGGSTDLGARLVGNFLAQSLHTQVVVENRTGADGNIGMEAAAKSAPDGYTVLVVTDQAASTAHIFRVSFDPLKTFVPVVQISRQPVVLAVHPSLGVSTLDEFLALAKRQPGMSFATSGVGSQQHMVAEWFAKEAGIKGLVLAQWLGVFVPAGTPGAIVERLNAEINKALAEPSIRDSLLKAAQEPVGGSAAQFDKLFRDDYDKYARLVKELNIHVN